MAAHRGAYADDPVVSVGRPPRPQISRAELDELIEQATIDCYNESEQVTGLFTMIEEHLALPFETTVLGTAASVERIDVTVEDAIIAICQRDGHLQTIAVLDLPIPAPVPDGWEWIEAYRRWLQ